jgi:hypothetical protein
MVGMYNLYITLPSAAATFFCSSRDEIELRYIADRSRHLLASRAARAGPRPVVIGSLVIDLIFFSCGDCSSVWQMVIVAFAHSTRRRRVTDTNTLAVFASARKGIPRRSHRPHRLGPVAGFSRAESDIDKRTWRVASRPHGQRAGMRKTALLDVDASDPPPFW